jgi:hypothetical protein
LDEPPPWSSGANVTFAIERTSTTDRDGAADWAPPPTSIVVTNNHDAFSTMD